MNGSGDGWSTGPNGVKLWGRFGAAGLFLLAGTRVLLQYRAAWTSQGNTWGIPGGARDEAETPVDAALRETEEECGIGKQDVRVLQAVTTAGPYDSGWSYTTVIARTLDDAPLAVTPNAESAELRWVELEEVEQLELLPALRDALPGLKTLVAELGHVV